MRAFARIGKQVLIGAVGTQPNQYIDQITPFNIRDCQNKNCPIYNEVVNNHLTDEEANNVCHKTCKGSCPYAKDKVKRVYFNEKNRYKIDKMKLSKNQIKVFLALHLWPIDGNGFIPAVNLLELAKTTNCTLKTVKEALNVLQSYGYAYSSFLNNTNASVFIQEYKTYHLTKEEGGSGYINFSKELIHQMVSIKSINELRLAIRCILEENYIVLHGEERVLKKKTVQNYLPRYIKSKWSELVENIKTLVNVSINKESENIELLQSEVFDYPEKKQVLMDLFSETISDTITKHNYVMDEEDFVSAVKLCFEYGQQILEKALIVLINRPERPDNIGGYLRSTSRKIFISTCIS